MSQKKNIDEYFKEGLTNYKIQPSDEVWKNIEKSIWFRASTLRKWLLIGIAAILLSLLWLSGWYFTNSENSKPEIATQLSEPENYSNTTKDNMTSHKSGFTDVVLPVNGKPDLNENTEDEKITTEKKDEKIPETRTKKQAYYDGSENKLKGVTLSEELHSPDLTGSIFSDIAYLPGLSVALNRNSIPEISDSVRELLIAKYLKKQRKTHFYTGLYFTPAMMYYPSVEDQFTWTAGLDFGMTYKNFYIETGIAYQEIKEQGIYTIDFRSLDSVGYYNQVQSFEINPLNSNEIFYNTKEVTVYDSVNHYTHAAPVFTYDYINIPLILGYKVYQKDRFTVGVEAGILFSAMVDKQIPAIDFSQPEYRVVLIHNETPERVDFNFRWQLAVSLDMKIVKAVSVSVKPVFNKYLNSVYDTQNGYPNVKPYSMGIQFGINYGF